MAQSGFTLMLSTLSNTARARWREAPDRNKSRIPSGAVAAASTVTVAMSGVTLTMRVMVSAGPRSMSDAGSAAGRLGAWILSAWPAGVGFGAVGAVPRMGVSAS